jgi:undecaprenyl phosphate N,N'-diacetylbacillosamine 1-phosphate transferase
MYSKCLKRVFDIIFSLFLIIILSPMLLIISIIVCVSMGYPILFKQQRIGKNEIPFNLYKFRSMTNIKDKNGNLLSEQDRVTRIGKTLRSLSLDELPELFSILIGKMSFVGPRPLPVYYGPYFTEQERKRHKVLGGLIPPDSLSGKTYTTWEEQFKYEVDYAENVNLITDIKIIFMTFKILFNRVKSNYGDDFDRPHLNIYRAKK